tara:strand:- start:4602 stop:4787 length:186 start_codon:yes stop_codon:yes gene_type:complete
MDLSDPRFEKRRVPWEKLVAEGYDPKAVMLEAQRQGKNSLARKARMRLSNQRRTEENNGNE